jgi:LmbE family N-acetylglucosaminyl deacetylase
MMLPVFTTASRVMLFAPHPDDESLGCGVLLQRAVGAGAVIRVIYATDGEDNPWPQRCLLRKWRLNGKDRQRWGKWRRAEALAALRVLGVNAADVRFIGLPDQQLSILLTRNCRSILDRLAGFIDEFDPTDLFVPSLADTHPDHSALAVMLRLVITVSPARDVRMRIWHYIVHGSSPAFFDYATPLLHSETEALVKRLAIARHKTQLVLSRRRFFSYAKRQEHFLGLAQSRLGTTDGSITWISDGVRNLRLKIRLPIKVLFASEPHLLLLAWGPGGKPRHLDVRLPVQTGEIELRDLNARRLILVANYCGNRFGGELEIPLAIFCREHPLFLKLERRGWFFDEAGWIEVPLAARQRSVARGVGAMKQSAIPFARPRYGDGI